jgi:hypothetical protein
MLVAANFRRATVRYSVLLKMEEDFKIEEHTTCSRIESGQPRGLFVVSNHERIIIGKVDAQADGFVMKKENCCVLYSSHLRSMVDQMKVAMAFFAQEELNAYQSEITSELKINGCSDASEKKTVTFFATNSQFIIRFGNVEEFAATFRAITRHMTTSGCFSPQDIIMLENITTRAIEKIKNNEIEWSFFDEMTPQKAETLLPAFCNGESLTIQVKAINFVISNRDLIKSCIELKDIYRALSDIKQTNKHVCNCVLCLISKKQTNMSVIDK